MAVRCLGEATYVGRLRPRFGDELISREGYVTCHQLEHLLTAFFSPTRALPLPVQSGSERGTQDDTNQCQHRLHGCPPSSSWE